MIIETVPLFGDNYAYLVICDATRKAAAIDPADPGPVLSRAAALGVDLVAIWNTHHHPDHAGGNAELLRRKQVAVYAAGSRPIAGLTHEVADDERIQLGELEARAIHAPGHTLDGIVYWVGDAAFTGDALFGGGCGRMFEGDATMMYRSLNEKLAILPDETRIFFGHEYTQKNLSFATTVDPHNKALAMRVEAVEALRARGEPTAPSTWAEERLTNPFLRCDSDDIRRVLQERLPDETLDDPVAVFAALRRLRDRW